MGQIRSESALDQFTLATTLPLKNKRGRTLFCLVAYKTILFIVL